MTMAYGITGKHHQGVLNCRHPNLPFNKPMSKALKLDSMTLEEKLAAMNLLWTDLSSKAAAFQSPQWHQAVLDARDQQARAGLDEFENWNTVITQLREELHANQAADKRES